MDIEISENGILLLLNDFSLVIAMDNDSKFYKSLYSNPF